MAYKIVLTNRFSKKLTSIFSYLENNYSQEVTRALVDTLDNRMELLAHQPQIGIRSTKISGVYQISITRRNKLYYQLNGRKIIMLDMANIVVNSEE
jgi:plasmid stabilization system protein ParE